MPSEKSARVAAKRALRNRPIRNSARTLVRRAQDSISGGGAEAALADTKAAIKVLDKAAQKGIIHKNNAARRKSRLMAKLNRLQDA